MSIGTYNHIFLKDINQKNLIQYLCQNSLFVIDKLLTNSLPKNNAEMHGKM